MSAQPPPPARTRPAARAVPWSDAGLVSGEAVALEVRVARLGSRVLALLLDVLTQLVAALLLAVLIALLFAALPFELVDAALNSATGTLALVLVLVGYPVLMERFNNGQTVGKLAVGLRVISADGGPVELRQSLTRALVGVAVEWPGLILPLISWVAGVTVMLTDRRGRRLGDLVAGTLVVHTRTASVWRPIPTAVPPLVGWAYTLDLSRLDDKLVLAVRQYLARVHLFAEPARTRLARGLWAEVAEAAAVTTPPPPLAAPETVYLAAVLGERHRRAVQRLQRTRAVTSALWPELVPSPPTMPIRPASPEPATTGRVTPSQPSLPVLRPAAAPPTQPDTPAARPATVAGERPGA